MYGENGDRLRAELAELLRQHRIQPRIGGPGTHTVPITSTSEQRRQIGDQISHYRQSALVWCHQATVAVAPDATSALTQARANPFRPPGMSHGPLAELQRALEHSTRASTSRLPTLEELTTPQPSELVEHWRQVARAAALGEHDFDAGLGHGRLDAQQRQTVIADIAAVVRALVILDQRYANIPGWEKLDDPHRLGWSALACALDASLTPPDYSVDDRGWRPPETVISGPGRRGLLGVLQAEHNLSVRLREIPNALNLRLVVDSQRIVSHDLAKVADQVDPELHARWLERERTHLALQRALRDVTGRLGRGGDAVAHGTRAVSRLKAVDPHEAPNVELLAAFDTVFANVDSRIAHILKRAIEQNIYLSRASQGVLDTDSAGMVKTARQRHVHLVDTDLSELLRLVRGPLNRQPTPPSSPSPSTPPSDAARGRADLHAALVHRPARHPVRDIHL